MDCEFADNETRLEINTIVIKQDAKLIPGVITEHGLIKVVMDSSAQKRPNSNSFAVDNSFQTIAMDFSCIETYANANFEEKISHSENDSTVITDKGDGWMDVTRMESENMDNQENDIHDNSECFETESADYLEILQECPECHKMFVRKDYENYHINTCTRKMPGQNSDTIKSHTKEGCEAVKADFNDNVWKSLYDNEPNVYESSDLIPVCHKMSIGQDHDNCQENSEQNISVMKAYTDKNTVVLNGIMKGLHDSDSNSDKASDSFPVCHNVFIREDYENCPKLSEYDGAATGECIAVETDFSEHSILEGLQECEAGVDSLNSVPICHEIIVRKNHENCHINSNENSKEDYAAIEDDIDTLPICHETVVRKDYENCHINYFENFKDGMEQNSIIVKPDFNANTILDDLQDTESKEIGNSGSYKMLVINESENSCTDFHETSGDNELAIESKNKENCDVARNCKDSSVWETLLCHEIVDKSSDSFVESIGNHPKITDHTDVDEPLIQKNQEEQTLIQNCNYLSHQKDPADCKSSVIGKHPRSPLRINNIENAPAAVMTDTNNLKPDIAAHVEEKIELVNFDPKHTISNDNTNMVVSNGDGEKHLKYLYTEYKKGEETVVKSNGAETKSNSLTTNDFNDSKMAVQQKLASLQKDLYECPICCRCISGVHSQQSHMKMHKSESASASKHAIQKKLAMIEKNLQECLLCSRFISGSRRMEAHTKMHKTENLSGKRSRLSIQKKLVRIEQDLQECPICYRIIFSKCRLDVHMKNHSAENEYSVQNKIATLQSAEMEKQTAIQNKLVSMRKDLHECSVCRRYICSKERLEDHMQTHIVETKYHSETKHSEKDQKQAVLDKLILLGKDLQECPICSRLIFGKQRLEAHIEIHNAETDVQVSKQVVQKKLFEIRKDLQECPICSRFISGKLRLEAHMKTHNTETDTVLEHGSKQAIQKKLVEIGQDLQECPVCYRLISGKHKLDTHIKIHNAEAKNVSEQDSKQNIQKKSIELGCNPQESPVGCSSGKEKLDVNMETYHTKIKTVLEHDSIQVVEKKHNEIGKDIQECPVCFMFISTKQNLEVHMKTHNVKTEIVLEQDNKQTIHEKSMQSGQDVPSKQRMEVNMKTHNAEMEKVIKHDIKQAIQEKLLEIGHSLQECPVCYRFISGEKGLKEHMKTHCAEIETVLKSDNKNSYQKQIVVRSDLQECPLCCRLIAGKHRLKVHIRSHRSKTGKFLEQDSKQVIQEKLVKLEQERFKENPVCCRFVPEKQGLGIYMKMHNPKKKSHLETDNKHAVQKKLVSMRNHLQECPVCCRLISGKVQFQVHIKMHSSYAESHSEQRNDVTIQQNIASLNNEILECPQCSKLISGKYRLGIHLKSHFKECIKKSHNTKKGKFVCKFCSASFTRKDSLNKHEKIHTGYRKKKEFSCSECGKLFKHKYSLKNHLNYHAGIFDFHCFQCGKMFVARDNLMKHLKRHFGVKKHSCSMCNMAFLHRYYLKRHLRTTHKQLTVS